MNPVEVDSDGRPLLADPQLAIDLLGTQRRRGDALSGELPHDHEATVWVREHVAPYETGLKARLMELRRLLRELLTAHIDGAELPGGAIDSLNDIAGQAPVTLAARRAGDGPVIERITPGDADAMLLADLARSALTLLTEPTCSRLRLCRAPGCTLFFLTSRTAQQWCSESCGNRARAARHYARHRQ